MSWEGSNPFPCGSSPSSIVLNPATAANIRTLTQRGWQFIGPDGRREMSGYPTIVQPIDAARDPGLAKRLWQLSEDLTGVRFNLANLGSTHAV